MKKIFSVLLLIFCLLHFIKAQNLGINTTGNTANASAGLDVDFSNKGILIPRVALTSISDAVTIVSPATSLLVYSSGGAVADGYYYNSGIPAAPIWSLFITTASASNGCFTNWQLFTANGTFTVPAGITKIKVCVYGGGAGGGCGNIPGGGGGGAGGYAEGTYAVTPAANFTVTIGSGGIGGLSGLPGTNGGTSSFGALISATGGSGGTAASFGGIGGIGIGGYLNTSLGNGGSGSTDVLSGNGTGGGGAGANISAGGFGGGAGGGGFGGGNGGNGSAAGANALTNTGAGGGGGGGVGGGGGNGAAGKVIVFW
jgi:hypothetical protein